jgi:nicotinamide riboside kinase
MSEAKVQSPLIVELVGSPSSGKTTLAAFIFAELKESSIPCELVPEFARYYIVHKREEKGLSYKDPLVLTDTDQFAIATMQAQNELIYYNNSSPDTVVVADSSPYNALLYAKEHLQNNEAFKRQLEVLNNTNRLLFYCPPVHKSITNDYNRIHSPEQIEGLDFKIKDLVKEYNLPVIELYGSVVSRKLAALRAIYSKLN